MEAPSHARLGRQRLGQSIDGRYRLYPVAGFLDGGTLLVGRGDHDGDRSRNPNNRVTAETIRIAPRG